MNFADLIDETDWDEAMLAPSAEERLLAVTALFDRRLASLEPEELALYEQALGSEGRFKVYFRHIAELMQTSSMSSEVLAVIEYGVLSSGISFEDFVAREDEMWSAIMMMIERRFLKD